MVDSFPNWIEQFIRKQGCPAPNLAAYAADRDAWLEKFACTYNQNLFDSSTAFHVAMNMGGVRVPATNTDVYQLLTGIDQELCAASPVILRHYGKHVLPLIEDPSDDDRRGVGHVFRVYETFESVWIKQAISHLGNYVDAMGMPRTEVGGLFHDGFCVSRDGAFRTREACEAALQSLQKLILRESGYTVAYKVKSLEMTPEQTSEIILTPFTVENNIVRIAQHFHVLKQLEHNGQRYLNTPAGFTYFNKRANVWMLDDDDKTGRVGVNYALSEDITAQGGYTQVMKHTSSKMAALAEIKRQAPQDMKFQDLSQGYLPFRDGYYDLQKRCFVSGSNIHLNCHMVMDRPFPSQVSEEDIEYVRNDLIFKPFDDSDMAWFYLISIARALFGFTEKECIIGVGESNCGKGKLTQLIRNSFRMFVTDVNGDEFMESKGRDFMSAERRNGWLIKCAGKRLAVVNELQENGKLSHKVFKSVIDHTSTHDCRKSSGIIQENVEIATQFLMLINSMPKFDCVDDAVFNRIKICRMNRTSIDVRPGAVYDTKSFFPRDPRVDIRVREDRYIDAFIMVIIDAAQRPKVCPPSVAASTAQYVHKSCIQKYVEDGDIEFWPTDLQRAWMSVERSHNDKKATLVRDWFHESRLLHQIFDKDLHVATDKLCSQLKMNYTQVIPIRTRMDSRQVSGLIGFRKKQR
jgi:hypothetical protein